jgi:hypothetical protein
MINYYCVFICTASYYIWVVVVCVLECVFLLTSFIWTELEIGWEGKCPTALGCWQRAQAKPTPEQLTAVKGGGQKCTG